NLGAGRIVYQSLTRIDKSIRDGEFFELAPLVDLVRGVKERGAKLHLMGLVSDGGVHSHIEHLFAALELAKRNHVEDVVIHCFMDGRDTSPTSGVGYIRDVVQRTQELGIGRIATIVGRYYAMDRDHRWDRTRAAYQALVSGEGERRDDPVLAMESWYSVEKTDEFIPPTVLASDRDGRIRDGDGVFFINFRADRARQITRALTEPGFDAFDRRSKPAISFVCMTEYDETFDLPVAFPPQTLENIFGKVVSDHGLRQLRIAETEKYAHVTFFFNGGVEEPFPGETRCLVDSPKVATYDLKPEMSAFEVTDRLIEILERDRPDVVILNYANPDMVGHTGSIPAAIRAVETIDTCVGRVVEQVERLGGALLITADHGNADRMLDEGGNPFTAHTLNPVHCIYVAPDHESVSLRDGILADIAPTMLDLLGIPKPTQMTGSSLLVPKKADGV
ncbi:MAG TPA: 2,3-bisphosphoglycerate-independent phosphoglycerate mutase, partial [Planctomycetota bacterium]|nr:2,3-bisphosphoglycerate-independent phosphoglycerate mutase [Planctomycetota bacterium]